MKHPIYLIQLTLSLLLLFLPFIHSQTCKDSAWLKSFVDRHNVLRARHGCPKLTLNSTTSAYAQVWANNLLAIDRQVHRIQWTYGENLFSNWDPNAKPLDPVLVVNNWYGEITMYEQFFNTDKEPNLVNYFKWGHFTQVVWKGTTSIGVGCAISSSGRLTYIVANYYPQGNIVKKFEENVPPPN